MNAFRVAKRRGYSQRPWVPARGARKEPVNGIANTEWLGYTASVAITGTGSFVCKNVGVNAQGEIVVTGTGSLTMQPLGMAGAGALSLEGTGSLVAEALELQGAGALEITGNASLAIQALQLAGLGELKIEGTGALTAFPAGVSATGTVGEVTVQIQRLFLSGRLVLSGRLKLSGELETQKIRITPEGGFAVKLANNTGSLIAKGSALAASPNHDNSVILQTSEFDCVGFAYEDIATGSQGWVVTTGVCDALLANSTSATRGYWAKCSATDGRIEVTTAPSGIGALATSEHFREVGHCLETKTGGTNVLVKILLHFL